MEGSMDKHCPDIISKWKENNLIDNGSDTDGSSNSPVSQIYYGVYIPPDSDPDVKTGKSLVFTSKPDALIALKHNKKSRFKPFLTEDAAFKFSQDGGGELSICDSPSVGGDESLFKGPKSQDLVQFRKCIEKDDLLNVRRYVEENPRYLVGSGDTPTILQEGSRYNALHVSARSSSVTVCSYLLNTISNISFVKKLYGSANGNLVERKNKLLDLYLNMPDKGCNETPLHFASKLGALEIVKILTMYQMCDKERRNKMGLTAMDIVCTRAPVGRMCYKQDIIIALDIQYYVPVLRSDDNSTPPAIGEPFTPANPPVVNKEVITPPLEIKAVAGPMTEKEATVFRKMWKTPPRTNGQIVNQRPELSDPDKGFEKVGRRLARDLRIEWKEYWPFLDLFTDITKPEGLGLLENHLRHEFEKSVSGFSTPVMNQNRRFEISNRTLESLTSKMEKLTIVSPSMDNDVTRSRITPRTLFHEDIEVNKGSNHTSNVKEVEDTSKNQESDDHEDSSDEEEYHTAPNSPVHHSPILKESSEEDLRMSLSETGPAIFLSGKKPTKIDKSVLEALENIALPLAKFPHITLWKNACLQYSKQTPRECWSTPVLNRNKH